MLCWQSIGISSVSLLGGRGCSETASWAEKHPLRLFSLFVHLDRLDGWPAILHGRSSSLSLEGRGRLGWAGWSVGW